MQNEGDRSQRLSRVAWAFPLARVEKGEHADGKGDIHVTPSSFERQALTGRAVACFRDEGLDQPKVAWALSRRAHSLTCARLGCCLGRDVVDISAPLRWGATLTNESPSVGVRRAQLESLFSDSLFRVRILAKRCCSRRPVKMVLEPAAAVSFNQLDESEKGLHALQPWICSAWFCWFKDGWIEVSLSSWAKTEQTDRRLRKG